MALGLALFSWGGCLAPGDTAPPVQGGWDPGECGYFPYEEKGGRIVPNETYLEERWRPLADESEPGFDLVSVDLYGWFRNRTEMDEAKRPAVFLDWNSYPAQERPELILDMLCYLKPLVEMPRGNNSGALVSTDTAKDIVVEALDALAEEQSRQTNEWREWREMEWPYVLFEDHFYSPTCRGYHLTRYGGGSSQSGCRT